MARTRSVTLTGVHGQVVEVELDVGDGVPKTIVVGLPDAAVNEARDRVRAALVNSGHEWPNRRITIGLSPAWVRKRGSGFDLALAASLLAACGEVPLAAVAERVLLGEVGLDGCVRPVRGVLPMVMAAVSEGYERVVVPAASAAEAALVPGAAVDAVASVSELVALLRGEPWDAPVVSAARSTPAPELPDLVDVVGQADPRAALEIAAAGGHHLLMHGAPGAGKTLLAERLPGILPPLAASAALEVTAIHSVAGVLSADHPWVATPPFQAPHHTVSAPALVGGGAGVPRPGAVSLAHHGVLFLDEAPEFAPRVLETLRQPLESGHVVLARSEAVVRYPARFQLVLAANPCPCGQSTGPRAACICSPLRKQRYFSRISGPLLDRIDLRVPVLPLTRAEIVEDGRGEESRAVAARVHEARQRTATRLADTPWRRNADVPGGELRSRFRVEPEGVALVSEEIGRGRLSARGVDRVLRVAWTLADLGGRGRPGPVEVAGALRLRQGGPAAWAA